MVKRKSVRPYVADIKKKIQEAEAALRVARGAVTATGTSDGTVERIREAAKQLATAVEMVQERDAALLKTRTSEMKLRRDKIDRLRAEADQIEAELPEEKKKEEADDG